MSNRYTLDFGVSAKFLLFWILLSFFSESVSSMVVTLDSIEIFNTHEWLNSKPEIYFQCKGENKTELPDVKKAHVLYNFNGEESWQPLIELPDKKCKRCGFYEKDSLKSDDVFEEWEFCPSDFKAPYGKYARFKEKEFNATFSCVQCVTVDAAASNSDSGSHSRGKGMHIVLVILIISLVTTVLVLGAVVAYKYWQKKRREQEQARFLKLFEDGDDIEDELGLGTVI
ncbi:hypothetical protein HS088_TW05G00269 [Tripterygium wilfordii]|uniref:DUF7953 domain-containing protein n=1 Tax=Tripterygium wilfordii TaxID=458696 RepID=A0A7J7DN82_TRIWF|nr:uncharacterized protein LOC119998836 [Tripterygium wilfordii]KAF5747546.1 hypothetical protein HS088_TW05G00269 [Tripterygium wilfordii]